MFVFSPPSKLHAFFIVLFCVLFNNNASSQSTSYVSALKSETSLSDNIYLCYGDSLILSVDSVNLVEGQELYFVFHTQEDPFIENYIKELNKSGIYSNNNSFYGKFFATAVIAEINDFINIELNDTCLVSSNTISITNLSPIQIKSEIKCEQDIAEVSISGGLPAFIKDSEYDVSGTHFNGKLKAGESFTFGFEYSIPNIEYVVEAIDENACSTSFNDEFWCRSRLPIDIVSFNGEQTDDGNLLTWVYNPDAKDDFFKIEVSKNGIDWLLVDTMQAKGTISEIIEYEYLDKNLIEEICYYRLSMTDLDGATSFISVIQIVRTNYLLVFPNVASNFLNVIFYGEAPVSLSIFDASGRIIISDEEEIKVGYHQKLIDISNLPSNIYFIVISSDEFRASKKFVVQR